MTMINVKDYGATGNGTTDDTSAIEAAVTAILSLQASVGMAPWVALTEYFVGQRRANAGNIYEVITQGTSASSGGPTTTSSNITDGSAHWKFMASGGSLTSYTVPTLYFPNGRYKVSNTILLPSFILGEQAIVFPADVADFDIFQPPQSGMCSIRGMTIRGGPNAIFVQGNDVTDLVLHISECEFMDQTNAAIKTSEDSSASTVFVSSCHFYMAAGGGCVLDALTGDRIVIRDSWLACGFGDAIRLGNSASDGPTVEILDCAGGPGPGTHTGPWIILYKGAVVCRNVRFGGEGDKVILQCEGSGAAASVTIEDCAAYSGESNNFEFYGLPLYTRIVRNIGTGLGVYLDSGIPDADKRALGNTAYFEYDGLLGSKRQGLFHDLAIPASDDESIYAVIGNPPSFREACITASALLDVFLPLDSTAPGYFTTASGTISGPSGTGLSGETTQDLTSSADGASYVVYFGQALTDPDTGSARADGVYTVVYDLDVGVHPVRAEILGGDRVDVRTLEPGRHLVHLHFPFGGFSSDRKVGMTLGFKNGGLVTVGRMRLFAGRVRLSTLYTELFGTSVPSTGQRFFRGDVVKNSQPASAGFERWVCAVNGYRAPAWVGSTNYIQYQRRKNGSNVYEVVTAGPSASSGGPTGTTSSIPDGGGTLVWRYIGPVATFYGAALVDTTPV